MTKTNEIIQDETIKEKGWKKYFGWKTKLAAGALAFITAVQIPYTVQQSEHAVITRLGNPVRVVLNPLESTPRERTEKLKAKYESQGVTASEGAGIHFKIPFIDTIRPFDRRLLEWDGYPEQINTLDKRMIWVDPTARWFIEDPLLYYKRLGTISAGQGKLDDIIDGEVRNVVTSKNLIELVRTNNREMRVSDEELKSTTQVEKVAEGREEAIKQITYNSTDALKEFGIGLHKDGVMIKHLVYVDSVKEAVEKRMIAERLRIAQKYISEGEGEYERIMGEKEKELSRINSEAYKTAENIRGQADAKATDIYAETYSKDTGFYEFTRQMDLYGKILPKNKAVLSVESPVFDHLKSSNGKK